MQCTCAPKPHLSLKIAASKSWTPQKTEVKQDLEDASCLRPTCIISVSFLYHFCISFSSCSSFLLAEGLSSNIGHVGHPQRTHDGPRSDFFWGSVAGLIGNCWECLPKVGSGELLSWKLLSGGKSPFLMGKSNISMGISIVLSDIQ